jgi:hypothetical protein
MPDIQTALKSALNKTLIDKFGDALDDWDDEGTNVPVVAHASTPPPPPPPEPNQPVSSSFPSTSDQKPTMTNIQKITHNITNNVSRETFNHVKNNPGSTRKEIITDLYNRGFAKDSVSSLLAQMRKAGLIHETNTLWYADADEYRPLKNQSYAKRKAKKEKADQALLRALKRAEAKANKDKQKDSAVGIAALHADATSTPAVLETPQPRRVAMIVRSKSPQDILKDLTVYQAQELYAHLKQIFGG